MKTITIKPILFFLMCLFTVSGSFSQKLSPQQWQEDLRFLQKTVHSDYPFLFKKVSAETWDAEVEKFYANIPNLEAHEIVVGLSRMVSLFEYGHTQIWYSTLAKNGVLPINLYYFKDGVYIEGTQKAHKQILGGKVVKIAGMPIDSVLAKIRPVAPVENEAYFKRYGLRFAMLPVVLHAQGVLPKLTQNVTVTVEINGKTVQHSLPTVTQEELSKGYGFTVPNDTWLSAREIGETPLYLKELNQKPYTFEYLANAKTLYVRQSSVFNAEGETLKEFYQRMFEFIDANAVDKLIYDVRLNGGGNNYNNKPLIQGIMERPEINKQGKFFYVIGNNTFSAAQNLTNEIENYTNAIFVGEETAENKNFYGDTQPNTLPNSKIVAHLSFAWWQDVPQWENTEATRPHFEKGMTFEEYRTNQDPVVQLALDYHYDSIIIDPMKHFTDLFIAGNMEQLNKDSAWIVKDPLYAHIPFEAEFEKVGTYMLSMSQFEAAIGLYSSYTELYPENVNFWEGLAKAYQGAGIEEAAEAAFAKANSLKIE